MKIFRPAHITKTTLIVMTGCFLIAACAKTHPPQTPVKKNTVLEVSTITLTPQSWGQDIHTFGSLESTEEVSISVDYAGTVNRVNFEEGQAISAGQTLIVFDSRKQQLRLEQAVANVASAQAQLERAQSTHARHRKLLANNLLSKELYKQSEADFESTKAALKQSKAAEALAQQELEETVIISPVDGIVESRTVEAGQTVLPGTSLAVVQVTDTMRVVTYVTEKEVNSLRIGAEAPVTSAGVPGHAYRARIELIGSSADPHTGNFKVKLAINNRKGLLREGMSARVHLKSIQRDNVLVLPRAALVDRNRRRVAFKVIDGKAFEVEPVLGVSTSDQIPVLAGLKDGDKIIIERLELITNATPVVDITATKQTASQAPEEQVH